MKTLKYTCKRNTCKHEFTADKIIDNCPKCNYFVLDIEVVDIPETKENKKKE